MSKMPNSWHRAWRRANPEKCAAAQRRYIEKNGAEVVALAKNHRLSMDAARAAIAAKPDACAICGRETKLYYDHDHATKRHRGWLCNRCNVGLHMIDDAALFKAAIAYLEVAHATV